jgi:hypothetical protein
LLITSNEKESHHSRKQKGSHHNQNFQGRGLSRFLVADFILDNKMKKGRFQIMNSKHEL